MTSEIMTPDVCSMCDCDVVVIGAGPAGLTVAINAASEGLRTTLVDSGHQAGGQARTSSLIENFPGFPDGVTGEELISRFVDQAARFDVDFIMPSYVVGIEDHGRHKEVVSDNGQHLICSSVVLAMGVSYRALPAKNLGRYLGRGIFYGSPPLDARRFEGQRVGIVGGANSAGQAAFHMATKCKGCVVEMFVRGDSIGDKMSEYLVRKLHDLPNVNVHLRTAVTEVYGGVSGFKGVTTLSGEDVRQVELDCMFILIGAEPKTGSFRDLLALDDHNFVFTGRDIPLERWHEERPPYDMETSRTGIFAVGDVRSGSVKRVASAVGEGAHVVPSIHGYRHHMGILNGAH